MQKTKLSLSIQQLFGLAIGASLLPLAAVAGQQTSPGRQQQQNGHSQPDCKQRRRRANRTHQRVRPAPQYGIVH